MKTCQGKTKTGTACRAPAGPGGLCFFHANPDSARTLGQIGGRKNRRSAVDLQIPDNMTAADLRNVTVQAIRLLLSGDMHAREASALAQLCNSVYRFIPIADLEARVTMLEQVAYEESGTSLEVDSTEHAAHGSEAAKGHADLEAEQQVSSSIDATASTSTHREDGADPPGEAAEA